jgi:S-adenosylmethionine/arginine decarboxylase-like enzyme
MSIWAESHAAIHTWDEDNYYAFDALRLLLTYFDTEVLNCVNLLRFQRSVPQVSNFQINDNWQVLVKGRTIGELETVNFDELG